MNEANTLEQPLLSGCYQSQEGEMEKETSALRDGSGAYNSQHGAVEHQEKPQHMDHSFGDKTISFWGSCVLNFNNITGPAVIVLPLLFQQAGWLLPCLGLLLMWLCSSFAAVMLFESMQRIPSNRRLEQRYEYCTLVRHYFGDNWSYVSQIGFNAGLTASNILSMVICSQVLDSVVTRLLGESYGVSYASWPLQTVISSPASTSAAHGCSWGVLSADAPLDSNSPPACNQSVISLGYLMAMLMCIPMGYLNLDGNMGFQWASMWAQLLCSFQFAYEFVLRMVPGSPSYCPGSGPAHTPLVGLDYSQVVGVCVFAFSYVSTIPSWANEKKPGVSVNKAVWLPSSVGVFLNILLGLLGAWAYNLLDISHPGQHPQPLSGTDDLLNLLDARADPRVFMCSAQGGEPFSQSSVSPLTELSVYIWGIGGYVPGIPILAIMVRYNLQNSGLLSSTWAFFWAVVAPWIFTAFFYQAQALLQFCSWVALLCQGFINLVVPILLYRQALVLYPHDGDLDSKTLQSLQNKKSLCKLPNFITVAAPSDVPSKKWKLLHFMGLASLSESVSSNKTGTTLDRNITSDDDLASDRTSHPILVLDQENKETYDASDYQATLGLLHHRGKPQPTPVPASLQAPKELEDEPLVESIPKWLGMCPYTVATSMGWFVTVAVLVSIYLSFVS